MPVWPDPRSLSVRFSFGSTQFDSPISPPFAYTTVSPGDDPDAGTDPGPVLESVRISRGRIGDSAESQPTSIALRLRNDDGEFSPLNVSGPHYGRLLHGTWCEVAVDAGSGSEEIARASALDFIPSRRGSGIDPQAAVPCLGLLNRLARDSEVKSATRRTIQFLEALPAYWPMEDTSGATEIASAVSGVAAMTAANLTFADDSDLAGSLPLPTFTATSSIAGAIPDSGSSDWFVTYLVKFPAALASATTLLEVTTTGTVARWVLTANATTVTLTGYDSANTALYTVSNSTTLFAALFSGEWVVLDILMNGSFGIGLTDLDGNGLQELGSGPASAAIRGLSIPAAANLAGMSIGHLRVSEQLAIFTPAGDGIQALAGYPGETARDRIERILLEIGLADIPTNIPAAPDSQAMGVLTATTDYRAIRDAEDVDGGMLFEARDGRITFVSIGAIYNRPIDLSLTFGTEDDLGDGSNVFPGDGDRDIYNIATVSSPDGAFAVSEETTGPKGSSTTVGVGPRRVSASRNIYRPGQLAGQAGWIVRRGTTLHPPYVLVLDLYAHPDLMDDWLAMAPGSRIRIADPPVEDYGPNDLDLVLIGDTIELDAVSDTVVIYCEPYEPYRVQQLADTPPADDTLDGWLIPDSMTVDADFDAGTDTSLDVDVTPAITTSADEMPLRIRAAGVLLEVTAVGAPSGTVQTLTVTQTPLNGVTKTITAGTVAEVADPLVLSL